MLLSIIMELRKRQQMHCENTSEFDDIYLSSILPSSRTNQSNLFEIQHDEMSEIFSLFAMVENL